MTYLISIFATLILFAGFLVLVRIEGARSRRIAASLRAMLDERAARAAFVASHVDFAAFIRDEVRHLAARTIHDVVHASLVLVRILERLLTRAVRALRARRERLAAREEAPVPAQSSEFAAAMKEFKDQLRQGSEDVGNGQ